MEQDVQFMRLEPEKVLYVANMCDQAVTIASDLYKAASPDPLCQVSAPFAPPLGLQADIKPLTRPCTTEEFNSTLPPIFHGKLEKKAPKTKTVREALNIH
eukprot:18685-Prorocentrum_minimum.AAC.1